MEYPQDEGVCTETQSSSHVPSGSDGSIITEDSHSPSQANIKDTTTAAISSLHPMTTRSRDGIRKPNPRYVLAASKSIPSLPKTVAEALNHPGWRQAMLDKLDSIYQNHTWSLTPATAEMNILRCRWVFTVKLNTDGTLNKLKAHLVAKGFNQEPGLILMRLIVLLFEHLQFGLFSVLLLPKRGILLNSM